MSFDVLPRIRCGPRAIRSSGRSKSKVLAARAYDPDDMRPPASPAKLQHRHAAR